MDLSGASCRGNLRRRMESQFDGPKLRRITVPFWSRPSWRFAFMLRLFMRGAGLLLLLFLLVPSGFSKNPAKKTKKELKKTDDTMSASSSDATASSDPAKPTETVASDSVPAAAP